MDLRLDSSGDLLLTSDGRLQLVDEPQLVAQRLDIILDTQRGEWFLDETYGVRYMDLGDRSEATILVKNPNIPVIDAELKSIILSVDGVARILSYASIFDPSARTFDVTFQVETDSDDVLETTILIGDESNALFDPEGAAGSFQIILVRTVQCLA